MNSNTAQNTRNDGEAFSSLTTTGKMDNGNIIAAITIYFIFLPPQRSGVRRWCRHKSATHAIRCSQAPVCRRKVSSRLSLSRRRQKPWRRLPSSLRSVLPCGRCNHTPQLSPRGVCRSFHTHLKCTVRPPFCHQTDIIGQWTGCCLHWWRKWSMCYYFKGWQPSNFRN